MLLNRPGNQRCDIMSSPRSGPRVGLAIMRRASGEALAVRELGALKRSLASSADSAATTQATLRSAGAAIASIKQSRFFQLFARPLRLVLLIGLVIAIVQQITGINAVFFYAPMIFEQSGIGTDASFVQAILVGVVNLVFTIVAISLIDRLGRKPLLGVGLAGMAVSMIVLAAGFFSATYTLDEEAVRGLPAGVPTSELALLTDQVFESDIAYKEAAARALGTDVARQYESELITAAINVNSWLILAGILFFVASFAASAGPVMWVLFSELFPNTIRGIAISFVGLTNSAVSFFVQLVFPWELANFGSGLTFLLYGIFAAIGLVFILVLLPETKGRSLEELESILVKSPTS